MDFVTGYVVMVELLKGKWENEKNSQPNDIEYGRQILLSVEDQLHAFSLAGSHIKTFSNVLRGALNEFPLIRRHRLRIDGGVSFREFWSRGDAVIAQLERGVEALKPQMEAVQKMRYDEMYKAVMEYIYAEARRDAARLGGRAQVATTEVFENVKQAFPNEMTAVSDAHEALEYLIDRGFLRQVADSVGGGSERAYVVAITSLGQDLLRGRAISPSASSETHIHGSQVNVGLGAQIQGSIVAAQSIEKSFNVVSRAEAPEALKVELGKLMDLVKQMSQEVPPETAEQVADDLDSFNKEALRPKPRREHLQVTADGLREVAETVSSLAVPIGVTLTKILQLLGCS